jgi:hypothetical protein
VDGVLLLANETIYCGAFVIKESGLEYIRKNQSTVWQACTEIAARMSSGGYQMCSISHLDLSKPMFSVKFSNWYNGAEVHSVHESLIYAFEECLQKARKLYHEKKVSGDNTGLPPQDNSRTNRAGEGGVPLKQYEGRADLLLQGLSEGKE